MGLAGLGKLLSLPEVALVPATVPRIRHLAVITDSFPFPVRSFTQTAFSSCNSHSTKSLIPWF